MKRRSAVLAGWVLAAGCAAVPAWAESAGAPTYTNARIVSINTLDRTFVIRQADGTQQRVELDDNVAGFGDVRAGDEVILALRAEPGWPRARSSASASR